MIYNDFSGIIELYNAIKDEVNSGKVQDIQREGIISAGEETRSSMQIAADNVLESQNRKQKIILELIDSIPFFIISAGVLVFVFPKLIKKFKKRKRS